MTALRWTWDHVKNWRLTVAYLILAVAVSLGYMRLEGERHAREHQACLNQQDGRTVLRAVITRAYSGQSLDLTNVPGFADLDPATQAFFSNIAVLSRASAESGTSDKDELLALVPVPTCGG